MKTPFDRQIVTQFESMEILLDHSLAHMGLGGEDIGHPVVMTEPVANPNPCRASEYLKCVA